MPDRDPLLTLKQSASFLSVSESTIRRLVRSGELPALRVRNQYRFEQRDLEEAARRATDRQAPDRGAPRPGIPLWAEPQVGLWAAGLADLLSDTKGVHAIVQDRRGSKAFSLLEPPGFRWGVNLWHSSGIDVLTDEQLRSTFAGNEVVIFDEMVQRGREIRQLKDRLTAIGISCRSICLVRRRSYFESGQLQDPDIEALDDLEDPEFFEAATFLSRLFDYCEPPLDPEHILISGQSQTADMVEGTMIALKEFGEAGIVWDDHHRTDSSIFAITLDRPRFFDTTRVEVPDGISVEWDGSCKLRIYKSYKNGRLTIASICYPTLRGSLEAWARLVTKTSGRYSPRASHILLRPGDQQSEREIERAYLDLCTDFAVELLRQATQAGLFEALGLRKLDQVATDHITAFFGKKRGRELAQQIREATSFRFGQFALSVPPSNQVPIFLDPRRSLVEVPAPTQARQALLSILPHAETGEERKATALTYVELMQKTRPLDELMVSLALDALIDGVGVKPVEVITWGDDVVKAARGYSGTEFGRDSTAVSAVHAYDAQAVRRTVAVAVAAIEQWLQLLGKEEETEITVAKLLVNIKHDWLDGLRPLAIDPYPNKHGLMPGLRTDQPYIDPQTNYVLDELVRLRHVVEVSPGQFRLRLGVTGDGLLESVELTGPEKAHLRNLVSTYATIQRSCTIVRRRVGARDGRGRFRDPLIVLSSVRNAQVAYRACRFEIGDWIQIGRSLFLFIDPALDATATGKTVRSELRDQAISFAQAAAFLDVKLAMYEAVPKLRQDISALARDGLYTAEVLLDTIDADLVRDDSYAHTDTPVGLLEWAVAVMRPMSSMVRQALALTSLVPDERGIAAPAKAGGPQQPERDIQYYAEQLSAGLSGLLPATRVSHVSNQVRSSIGDRDRERQAMRALGDLFEEVVGVIRGRIKDEPEIALERLRGDQRHSDLIKASQQFEAYPDLAGAGAVFVAVGDFYNFMNLAAQIAAWVDMPQVTEAVIAGRLKAWLAETVEEVQRNCGVRLLAHLTADNCILATTDASELVAAVSRLNEGLATRISGWDHDIAERLSWMRFGVAKVDTQMFRAVVRAFSLADKSRLPRGSIVIGPEVAGDLSEEISRRLTAATIRDVGEVLLLSGE